MARQIPAGLQPIIEAAANAPIELYELYLDSGTLYFAATDADMRFNNITYIAIGVRRAAIATHADSQVDKISIGLDDVSNELAQLIATADFRGRRCRILKVFRESLNDPTHRIVMFDGRMDSPSVDDAAFSVSIISYLDLLHRDFPGRVFSTLCNYKLGDDWCTVDLEAAENKVTGSALTGSTSKRIIASALSQADEYWRIGRIKFTSGSLIGQGRDVLTSNQAGTFVETRIGFSQAPAVGDTFEVVRGCNKTQENCINKFDNWPFYGGFMHIPQANISIAAPNLGGGGGKGGGK